MIAGINDAKKIKNWLLMNPEKKYREINKIISGITKTIKDAIIIFFESRIKFTVCPGCHWFSKSCSKGYFITEQEYFFPKTEHPPQPAQLSLAAPSSSALSKYKQLFSIFTILYFIAC